MAKGKIKAGILNVTGYIGVELARILARHPQVELVGVTGRSAVGKKLGEVFPHLDTVDLTIQAELDPSLDVVFSAMPHKASAAALGPFLGSRVKVIDLSADFRLKSPAEYREWYQVEHPYPEFLEEAVYGLVELHRQELASARLVATPGCYATGALLALAPAVKAGLIEPQIILDSKSGVSGAGRGLSLFTHFSEVNESVQAYSLEGHRHLPEIVQELRRLNPAHSPGVTFVPHLVPMTRGILTSCYAPLKEGVLARGEKGVEEIRALYRDFYRESPFVRVVDTPPATKHTLGQNNCVIYATVDKRTARLVVISCLDNLVKGGAGQGVQNMNLLFGLPETLGLESLPLFP